ncbi:MAG: adenine phosphoribosyltransferase [Candidatus Coatesbacteria bacterium]|nr:adenine phosphoribosyltransferase [Candidatus Coatesbacteria bacterium]
MDKKLAKMIRDVPDFPKEGIVFKDITTLLKEANGLRSSVDLLNEYFKDLKIDLIAGIESRGFIFGTPLAYNLGVGFIPIRKPGKLPAETFSQEYALEYGTDRIEMHKDAVREGQSVLIVDDLLATGGTAEAAAKLIENCGGKVAGFGFIIELTFLNGINKLKGYNVKSLIKY